MTALAHLTRIGAILGALAIRARRLAVSARESTARGTEAKPSLQPPTPHGPSPHRAEVRRLHRTGMAACAHGDAAVDFAEIDAADLKTFNDTFGHPAGDEVLIGIAIDRATARALCRPLWRRGIRGAADGASPAQAFAVADSASVEHGRRNGANSAWAVTSPRYFFISATQAARAIRRAPCRRRCWRGESRPWSRNRAARPRTRRHRSFGSLRARSSHR